MGHDCRVVAIVGPTAVGKTALSLELAARFDGEIVSADSRQICAAWTLVRPRSQAMSALA